MQSFSIKKNKNDVDVGDNFVKDFEEGLESNSNDIIKKITNVLFINGEETEIVELAKILDEPVFNLEQSLSLLAAKLSDVGLSLIVNNNKLSITTGRQYSDLLKEVVKYNINSDLTAAQLQALTIIAYLGPVSTEEISFVRGVQSVQTIRSLSTRGLIEKNKVKNTSNKNSDNSESDNFVEDIMKDKYILSIEALKFLGVSKAEDLSDFENIKTKLKTKMSEALNG